MQLGVILVVGFKTKLAKFGEKEQLHASLLKNSHAPLIAEIVSLSTD